MEVKIKKLSDKAVIPAYAKDGDAGMDLVATSINYDDYGNIVYGTGLAFEVPKGYVGLLFPRSSNAKTDLLLSNSVGILDSGYRGEVMFKFKHSIRQAGVFFRLRKLLGLKPVIYNLVDKNRIYKVGDRIGQIIIMPFPSIEFKEVDKLSTTERGIGGYGSTGK